MRGSHVIGEAATRAGCRFYAGYPITPQNELPEYMSERFAKLEGATFIQAESELAAINMVMGASMAGVRAMTSSSSPGISLKQEGISYMAGMELPAVVVNIMRGGPGLGNIAPTQQDYFQATRGGGHGGYRTIVLAPYSGQELVTLTMKAFDLADVYRTPVILLGDGLMGQMMEPVTFPDPIDPDTLPQKDWRLDGARDRDSRLIASLHLDPAQMEQHNWKLARKYAAICERETKRESYLLDDAVLAVVAFGTAARIAKGAVNRVRKAGLRAGLFRPITLWPFPEKELRALTRTIKHVLVFEMNFGQMVEDVRISVGEQATVHFHGRPGGIISTPHEIADAITKLFYRYKLDN
ncbi:MAG: 3-methyl-2-oxobutanoate dehydrogenase subunit VorB [Deltaproteobacteria bacterium]|nr:3-methyl-2-oxobutanoate dehydrogenase subunit VorB [Deltaproteobacteria bacterium]MBW2020802.1 3-methyl-2-oxobutanoate dehydrogenase subunit VorB [Deltaproteobacteria bacterium]MBW2075405.1 3-methyl-2-oxobutanoate dehydrogenase subunit VorB [Deltaproteobacteria bacterium]RLB81123.1 MAG: 3-methyl-2-oxobutanoate dehydrogenase subunit beta [Deltaproteobacteria bacterium]